MRFLGIDFGTKRVGIALSDEEGRLAFAHATLSNTPDLVKNILALAREEKVDAIVLGESVAPGGGENILMGPIQRLRETLAQRSGLPTYLEPEFWSSAEAGRFQGEKNDASAAAIILERFLARHNFSSRG